MRQKQNTVRNTVFKRWLFVVAMLFMLLPVSLSAKTITKIVWANDIITVYPSDFLTDKSREFEYSLNVPETEALLFIGQVDGGTEKGIGEMFRVAQYSEEDINIGVTIDFGNGETENHTVQIRCNRCYPVFDEEYKYLCESGLYDYLTWHFDITPPEGNLSPQLTAISSTNTSVVSVDKKIASIVIIQ